MDVSCDELVVVKLIHNQNNVRSDVRCVGANRRKCIGATTQTQQVHTNTSVGLASGLIAVRGRHVVESILRYTYTLQIGANRFGHRLTHTPKASEHGRAHILWFFWLFSIGVSSQCLSRHIYFCRGSSIIPTSFICMRVQRAMLQVKTESLY